MTVFTVTVIIQNYIPTSKQSNKHILIVVNISSISTNNIGSATEIRRFNSASEVQRVLGYKQTCITQCLLGHQRTAYGFI